MIETFAERIDNLSGQSVETPGVRSLLAELGEVDPLEADPDDGSVYVDRPELGFSIIFRDPARIKNQEYASRPKGLLILFYCFFYSEGHEGYREFLGKLPRDLAFSHSRNKVLQELSPPSWKREKEGQIISERWDYADRSLHVTYTKDHGRLRIVCYGVRHNIS